MMMLGSSAFFHDCSMLSKPISGTRFHLGKTGQSTPISGTRLHLGKTGQSNPISDSHLYLTKLARVPNLQLTPASRQAGRSTPEHQCPTNARVMPIPEHRAWPCDGDLDLAFCKTSCCSLLVLAMIITIFFGISITTVASLKMSSSFAAHGEHLNDPPGGRHRLAIRFNEKPGISKLFKLLSPLVHFLSVFCSSCC